MHGLERKIGGKDNYVMIGESGGCFRLLSSSALKFSFANIFLTDEPAYFSINLNSKELNKNFYVFISALKFSERIDVYCRIAENPDLKDRLTFVVYKSIYDQGYKIEDLLSNPMLKPFKKTVLKSGERLKNMNATQNAPLIIIDGDCSGMAKSGRNLNYTSYLEINNSICGKFECRLCYQKTKCPAIKVNHNGEIKVDPEVCNMCKLCIDICRYNAIKYKKKKKIKIKKSLESKINL